MPGCETLEDILVLALDAINYIQHRSFVIDKTPEPHLVGDWLTSCIQHPQGWQLSDKAQTADRQHYIIVG